MLQSYFVTLRRLDCSACKVFVYLHLYMFGMFSLCIQNCNVFLWIWPYCFFLPHFRLPFIPFSLLCQMNFSLSSLTLSTLWWCLQPDAVRRERFKGCVTLCPLNMSLCSGRSPDCSNGLWATAALTLCISNMWPACILQFLLAVESGSLAEWMQCL